MSENLKSSVHEQNDQFAQRRNELNRRMLVLPMVARRAAWGYYFRRLCELNEDLHNEKNYQVAANETSWAWSAERERRREAEACGDVSPPAV